MLEKLKYLISVVFLASILLLPSFVLASGNPVNRLTEDNPVNKLIDVGDSSGFNTDPRNTDLPVLVGKIIGAILTLLGIVFLALIVYAGILWMIAAGNEDKVTRSKDTMRRAVIGLVIVVGAYAISQFVVYSILS